MNFAAMINRQVTLRGIAYNALGAAVIADPDDDWQVYVDGLDAWDDAEYGKPVEITGLLVREPIAPEAVVSDGGHTHGAVGKALIIRGARWRLLP